MLSFNFNEVLAHAVSTIERHGFISKDMALVNGTDATSSVILDSLVTKTFLDTDRETLLSNEVEQWLKNAQLSGDNEFMQKCRNLIDNGVKSIGELGMIGSVVLGYQTYLRNKDMIDMIGGMKFSNVPLGVLKSTVKDLQLEYIGTIYLNGGAVRENCFTAGDNQLVVLYKRKPLSKKATTETYVYSGSIRKTEFKYNSLMTVLRNHRYDIKIE
jgi:hypothetical protein